MQVALRVAGRASRAIPAARAHMRMNAINERNEASVHELMNAATEWLQYAERLTESVAEVIGEAGELKGKEMANILTVIDALMRRGLDYAMRAHTQMVREQLRTVTGALEGD